MEGNLGTNSLKALDIHALHKPSEFILNKAHTHNPFPRPPHVVPGNLYRGDFNNPEGMRLAS